MDDAKKQLIDKLQSASNVLVTVSRDPTVDQLASCIGLTLMLNKKGKHAAAVFSGKVPSTIEFLKPDETLEKNTDSLRDFIISLDKAKADKLRYKVEEDVVRIFITPYKTSLSEDDLEFSEGDFNVDVVVALGVKKQEDLDQAITAHGRILHDATVTSINTTPDGGLGTINWYDPEASSLSELVTDLAQIVDDGGKLMDGQIATALLTGIVSETGRFSNDRTSSQTMSASAALLAAGANQQLVASKLEAGQSGPKATGKSAQDKDDAPDTDNGELEIDHTAESASKPEPIPEAKAAPPPPPPPPPPAPPPPKPETPASNLSPGPKMVTEPPKLGGTLTANSQEEHLDPVTDPMSMPQSELPALLDHKAKASSPPPPQPMTPPPPSWSPPASAPQPAAPPPPEAPAPQGKSNDKATLTEIEKSVDSPHLASASDLDSARSEVDKALAGSGTEEPIEALNARPLGSELHDPGQASSAAKPEPPVPPADPQPSVAPTSGPAVLSDAKPPLPPLDDTPPPPKTDSSDDDADSPPPVPPPIPFQFDNSPPPPQ